VSTDGTDCGGLVSGTLADTVLGNDCSVAGVLLGAVDGVDVDSPALHADNMPNAATARTAM
jgi:hypothetical protein